MTRVSNRSLYDTDESYSADAAGSRLTPRLKPLIALLDRLRARRLLRTLNVTRGTAARVLDIGAVTGGFLASLGRLSAEVHGTTASRIDQAAAARRYGLEPRCDTKIPVDMCGIPFDAVTYWHVFEHLDDPDSHDSVWPQLLAPGGVVLVAIPQSSFGYLVGFRG